MTRIVIASALLLVFCSHASAQSSPWQREERTTGGWTFTPGTALGGIWDSGMQTNGNPVYGTLFQKWVGNANPFAELDYNGKRSHVNLGYAGNFEKYFGYGTLWEQQARAGVRRVLSPHVTVNGDMAYSRVPTTDRLGFSDGVVPFVNINSQAVTGTAGISWRTSQRTTVFANYQFDSLSLDENLVLTPFGTLRDGYSHTPSVGLTRDFTARLSLGATGAFSRQYVADGFNRFDIKKLTGEFSYRWSPVMSVSGGAGVTQVVTAFTELRTTAPTFHGGFTRLMRVWELSSRYERSIQQIFGFGTLATTHTISGDAYMPFADRKYYLDGTVSYAKTDALRDLGLGLNLSTLWTNIAVGRQLLPRLHGEVYLAIAHQGGAEYDATNRTRLGFQIVTSKPLRIQ
jgi:hypothetical protein